MGMLSVTRVLGDLGFAHDELRAALDLLLLVGIAEGNGVAGVVLPLDDFEKLRSQIIDQAHSAPFRFLF
jgi:hypothetical protein